MGRKKGRKNNSTILKERLINLVLASDYKPKYTAWEVLQRVKDGSVQFSELQIKAAEKLLPTEVPSLSAVMVRHAPPPPPAADALLAGADLELLEVLRDALEELQRGRERVATLQIEGKVDDENAG